MIQSRSFVALLFIYTYYRIQRLTTRSVATLSIIITIIVSPAAQAMTRHALLVGVSEYPNLEQSLQLDGPKYDVRLARDFLLESGFLRKDMRVLADGVDAADGLPTSTAIKQELAALAKRAKKGDFVYVHFAGHGSQQPVSVTANKHDEDDGLDEIFLPRDVKGWNDQTSMVENSIVDDDIRDALTAIRSSGAFVWMVFDSCHSGTMTRSVASGGDKIRMRDVKPHELGIPRKAMQRAANSARSHGPTDAIAGNDTLILDNDSEGGFVAFYAARSTETTPEMMLPKYHPDSEPHGLFTHTLFNTLGRFPGATYRQVIQQVLQEYGAIQWRATTPLYEGTALDAPVFGDTPVEGQGQQWRFEHKGNLITVHAGTLHEVTEGSVLALVSSAAVDDKIVGYVKLTQSGLLSSTAEITAHGDKPAVEVSALPKSGYARMVEIKTDFTLRVARPAAKQLQSTEGKVISNILNLSDKRLGGNALVEWVSAGEPADLRLAIDNGLWLLPPTELLEESWRTTYPMIRLSGRSNDEVTALLMDNLARIAKVRNIMRLAKRRATSDQTESTMTVERESGNREKVEPGTVPRFYSGDALELRVHNTSRTAQDITILFIGADYSIQPIFPINGELNRVEAGDEKVIDGISIDTSETIGREQLVVIATQARPGSTMEDFGFLAQSGVPKSRGEGSASSVRELLQSAGFGSGTSRGAARRTSATEDKLSIKTIDWITVSK
jgi:hypothetical protein